MQSLFTLAKKYVIVGEFSKILLLNRIVYLKCFNCLNSTCFHFVSNISEIYTRRVLFGFQNQTKQEPCLYFEAMVVLVDHFLLVCIGLQQVGFRAQLVLTICLLDIAILKLIILSGIDSILSPIMY